MKFWKLCRSDDSTFAQEVHTYSFKEQEENPAEELRAATCRSDLERVKKLVANGAPLETGRGTRKSTPLFVAANNDDEHIVRFLAESGADLETFDHRRGWTPLRNATMRNYESMVRCLIESGADVEAGIQGGETPLISAAMLNYEGMVRCLIELGADVEAVDVKGKTALMKATEDSYNRVVRCLVEGGANIDAVGTVGTTALIQATRSDNEYTVECLVECGANMNLIDHNGKTALMYASISGYANIAQLLVKNGADVNLEDQEGHSALDYAVKHAQLAVQQVLMPFTCGTQTTTARIGAATAVTQSILAPNTFISPFEVELVQSEHKTSTGDEFRAKWLDADVLFKLSLESAETFKTEVDTWHHMRHPNILKLYGACDVGHHFFVSEVASKGSITEYLAACDPQHRTPWKFLLEAAMGLEYLHERGLVHGNIRSSCMLIGNDGKTKLTEFGLGGPSSNLDTKLFRKRLRWIRWEAPERLNGAATSFAADVYSFGLCIIEVITGEMPWDDLAFNSLWEFKKHWLKDPDEPYFCEPECLPVELNGLISQMCAHDRRKRASAASIVRMLEPFAAKEKTQHETKELKRETLVTMAEYYNGDLPRQWETVRQLFRDQEAPDDVHLQVFRGMEAAFAMLKKSSHPETTFKQFRDLSLELQAVLNAGSFGNRVHRLSTTRAAGDSARVFLRDVSLLLMALGGSENSAAIQAMRGDEHRAQQVELFVSDTSWWTSQDLESDEERLALLTFLKAEIERHGDKYSSKQLAAMKQAYADVSVEGGDRRLQVTTPRWFIPWYELIVKESEQLGAGGFGAVYRGKWLDSEVIVKKLNVGDGGDAFFDDSYMTEASTTKAARQEVREMFEREAEIWFGLSHPHVVRLFGACHVGEPFFVCEYATNGALDAYLQRHPSELWTKLHEAALGVLYLHERGIIHGDLKCNNVVIGSDERAKVADFGLSASLQTAETHRVVTGAWQWVAPECLKEGGSRLSAQSDVYSFGMCVVEAMRVVEAKLLGKSKRESLPYPWRALDNQVVKHHVLKGALPPRPSIDVCSDEQWTLVERMCRLEPEKRFKMTTVVDELARMAGRGRDEGDSSVVEVKSVSDAIAELEAAVGDGADGAEGDQLFYQRVYRLLLERLKRVSVEISGDTLAHDRLSLLVGRAREGVADADTGAHSLTQSAEASLRAYALHRELDKLIAAELLPVDGADDWKSRCEALMRGESVSASPSVTAAA